MRQNRTTQKRGARVSFHVGALLDYGAGGRMESHVRGLLLEDAAIALFYIAKLSQWDVERT